MALLWLAAGLPGCALAQSPASGQEPQLSSTVVVTAPRPVKQPMADAEARLRKTVKRQATGFARMLSYCLSGPITHPDAKIMCARSHIRAEDKSVSEALAAFEQHDYASALKQFESAYVKLGYPDAALMLAHMHLQGLGTTRDAVQGIRWLRAVAEERFNPFRDTMRFNPGKPEETTPRIDAAMTLASLYQLGGEVERDWDEAERWYAKAAEFGFIPAWNALGVAYLSGEGANRNASQAINYFIKAAEAGYGPSAYNLGNLYAEGSEGVKRDPDQAARYFRMAAETAHPDALLAVERCTQAKCDSKLVTVVAAGADTRPENLDIAAAAPQLTTPAAAGLAGAMASAAVDDTASDTADDTVDMTNDTLNLALSELARNPEDTEALRNLRRAADELNLAATASTESADQADDIMFVVRVTGLRAVPWKSYGAMRAAVSAYEKHKSLAPDAVFRFAVMPPAGMKLPPNFALRVRTEQGQEFPISLEHGELFTLPPLPEFDGDADLVSNFKGGALRIGLLVHTRTVPPEKLRLGDLRLRYEITAAIEMFDNPGEYDTKCRAPGRWNRCKRPTKAIWHRPWTATSGAWIVEGSRRVPLQASENPGDHMYRMPIASKDWGNNAIIEFDYKAAQLRPRKLFETAIYDGND
ncbi:tetratricopeptide repeat protein [Duganella sp. FT27W]|uniref:tetratricopeptide repeat protein n=1 Tax=Duganella sp. FT27W TaxID=2654636 RepID=UPI00128B7770|nr:hypothetical protein [Duganella sp. FT27W]